MKLQKVGRKGDPSFRVVIVDSKKNPKSGKCIEILGMHDPKEKYSELKSERALHWLKLGAQPTDTVHNLLIKKQIIKGKKTDVSSKKNVGKKQEETGDEKEEFTSDVESAAKIAGEEAATVSDTEASEEKSEISEAKDKKEEEQ